MQLTGGDRQHQREGLAGSEAEQVDSPGDANNLPRYVVRLLGAEGRDQIGDVLTMRPHYRSSMFGNTSLVTSMVEGGR